MLGIVDPIYFEKSIYMVEIVLPAKFGDIQLN